MARTVYKLLLALLVLVGLLAVGLAYYIVFIVRHVSTGQPIQRFPDARNALLVIDIQTNYSGPANKNGFPDATGMITRTNLLIERASQAGWVVLAIGQEYPDNPLFRLVSDRVTVPGCPGSEMDPRLQLASATYFPKNVGDAFSNPSLEAFLAKNRVNRLALVGLDAEACVMLTAQGARNRGFEVRIVGDAVLTRSKRPLGKILKEYESFGASVVSSDDLLAELPAPR